MDFSLNEKQQKVVDICAELAKDFSTRADQHDMDRSAPTENYEKLREAGLYGMAVPEEYGGLGIGFTGYVAAMIELGQGCASTANSFNMHNNMVGLMIQLPEIPEEKKQLIADLAVKERKLICASVSAPNSSSLLGTATNTSLQARKVPGGYTLHGKKAFCSMVESSDYCFVYAHPEEDPNLRASLGILVPIDKGNANGVTIKDDWDPAGMRATRSNTVIYDGIFVPEELVFIKTENHIQDFLVRGANWSFGGYTGAYLGIGYAILNFAIDLLKSRKSSGFDQPLGYHPINRNRIGTMASELHSAKFALMYAAWHSDTYGPTDETFHQFLRAKYSVAKATQFVVQSASVASGLHGLMKAYPLERMIRDVTTAPIMPPNIDAAADLIGLYTMGLDPDEAMPPLRPSEEKVMVKG